MYHICHTAKMFRSPVDAEPFVTAGGCKVGDGGAEAVTVSSRVTPARNRNVLTIETNRLSSINIVESPTSYSCFPLTTIPGLLHSLSAQ